MRNKVQAAGVVVEPQFVVRVMVHPVPGTPPYKSIAQLMYPRSLPAQFSIYQSGVDFERLYSNRRLKPLTLLIGLWQGCSQDLEIPLLIELVHAFCY